jgi:hypothetical protein
MEDYGKRPHVVLYSCSQGCFHVEEASISSSKTLANLQRGVTQDYVLLAICNSFDEAFDAGVKLRKIKDESPLWPSPSPIEEV